MQKQGNKVYKYFIDGKEVDNRTDYLNATMSGYYVSYFDGDSVFSVSFSNFFGENTDNNKMIKREVNGHLSDAINSRLELSKKINEENLEKYKSLFTKVDKCSPQCFCDGSCKNPQKSITNDLIEKVGMLIKNNTWTGINPNGFVYDTPISEVIIESQQEKIGIMHIDEVLEQKEKEEKVIKDWNKGYSTRHKSQNGETHNKTCMEIIKEKQDKFYPFLRVNFQVGEDGAGGCKVYTNFHTVNEVKEYMKDTEYTHYFVYDSYGKKVSWGSVNKDSKVSAEKTEKEEDLVFKKDSEIHNCNYTMCGQKECNHCYPTKDDVITNTNRGEKEMINELNKEELPPHQPLNLSLLLTDWVNKISGTKDRPTTFTVDNWEGIKESNGKTDYSEINLEILDLMAERFTANKHKYPQGNMKKPIDIKSLEWALFRHLKKMIQPIENDTETYKEHLSAILCNASMILDQLNLKEVK